MRKRVLAVTLTVCVLMLSVIWTTSEQRVEAFSNFSREIEGVETESKAPVYSQVNVRSEEDRQAASRIGTIVEDYGSFLLIENSSFQEVAARVKNSEVNLEIKQIDSSINIRSFSFEPTTTDPAQQFRTAYKQKGEERGDYYLVQFIGTVTDAWLEEVRSTGSEIVQYVPNQAFLVYANSQSVEQIKSSRYVRWVGLYQPVYKVGRELMWVFGQKQKAEVGNNLVNYGMTGAAEYEIAVASKANLSNVEAQLIQMKIEITTSFTLDNNFFNVIRAKLLPEQVRTVTEMTDILAVDPYIEPKEEDERSSQIVAGNYSGNTINPPGYNPTSQFGVDGTGVTVAVVDSGFGIPGDGGFYITPTNAVDGNLRGATPGSITGHGHLVASIIAGTIPFSSLDPLGYNYGRGVAPGAHLVNIPAVKSGYSATRSTTQDDIVTASGPNGVRASISNNSFGSGLNGNSYDSLAAQYDGFVRDSSLSPSIDPLTIVFSAGNDGSLGLSRPKAAKNVIVVGSSKNLRTELSPQSNNLEDMSSFSSRGFTLDGRVKPDLVAPGQVVTGGRSGSTLSSVDVIDAAHVWSDGTSFSTPHVSGAAALFTQFWKNSNSGQNPSPALIKAALINGAIDMTGVGASAPIPNGAEGWGRLNLKNVLNTGVPTQYINQTQALSSPGQAFTFVGTVANTSRPVRVSLVWTDPPAMTDPALVNNLDLEVTVNGQIYKGNVFNGGLSITGGSADSHDNVENVFLPAGTSGSIRVRVIARSLNGDGILGDTDITDQHFALVIFNANSASIPIIDLVSSSLQVDRCAPSNNAIDPGERVTVSFALQNTGTSNAANVVATLQASGGVTQPSPAQSYGTLIANGLAVSRSFTFVVDPTIPCGGTVVATLSLGSLGSLTISLDVGTRITNTPQTFANSTVISIPVNGTANPYPSTINVSGLVGTVSKVTVRLNGFSHTFPDDMDILLVSPTGQAALIFSDVGGSTDAVNLNFTLDDAAAAFLPDVNSLVSGTFRPTNGGGADNFPASAPAPPYGSTLSIFNGINPNGAWNLYVVDDKSNDSGSFSGGWSLTITTTTPVCTAPCNNIPDISVRNLRVTERENVTFTVSLSNPFPQPVTVMFATADGTAKAGSDYTVGSGTITFPSGSTTQSITIPVLDDDIFEEEGESFFINLSNPTNGTIVTNQGRCTILDDDPVPTLSINNVIVTEGNTGTFNAVFTVSLSNPSFQPISVSFATANGTAAAGNDYTATTGTLTFPANSRAAQMLSVPVIGDNVFEPNETFVVNLGNVINATITTSQGTGTITNDDPMPTISINDVIVPEGNTGTSTATFMVSLSNPSVEPITVMFATADGTATATRDYTATSGTLTFAPEVISQSISVSILGDISFENDETLFINLTNPFNATIADSEGKAAITNDDSFDRPTVYVADTGNSRVQSTTDGGLTWKIVGLGTPGSGAGQFRGPRAVVADATDTIIFVADTDNNRLQRSTDSGLTWKAIATVGSSVNQVRNPAGLAYDEVRDILYVSDTANNRITFLTNASTSIANWQVFAGTTVGSSLGQVRSPSAIAVDRVGNVYVADTANSRIQFYTLSTGQWAIFNGATSGSAIGKVNSPRGVYVDNSNNVVVADTNNNRIQIFRANTSTWEVFMNSGATAGLVRLPEGAKVSSTKDVFVGDTGNNLIQKKPLDGGTASIIGSVGSGIGSFRNPTGVQ